MKQSFEIGQDLIEKYNCLAPRYTSYPTAPQFNSKFGAAEYREHSALSNSGLVPKNLSIYLHIPFCLSLCNFCGCNKIITQRDNRKVNHYLDRLMQEIAMRGKLFNDDRLVSQIHFGGGTPTFLGVSQLAEILDEVASQFHLSRPPNIDISIEIDPRSIDPSDIDKLAEIGFSRFSIGVQDFSPDVQKVINREQPLKTTLECIRRARSVGKSVNVDLITGLPLQTPESFAATLQQVIDTGVSRIAAYSFAYMPERIKAQRLFDKNLLPAPEVRLEIVRTTREILSAAGYQHIGMDHYALPADSLAKAHLNGTLQRNFQGYTTHKDTDLIGIGISAISKFETAYAQNSSSLSTYNEMIDDRLLPIARGLSLNDDDRLRAMLIQQIMCRDHVDLSARVDRYIETSGQLSMHQYFARELPGLQRFVDDQLVFLTDTGFEVTAKGRYFTRQIAAIFDRYLNSDLANDKNVLPFSRTI